jgi:hypothetical protein
MKTVHLTPDEIDILNREDPETKRDGGWQSLLARLQNNVDENGNITLTDQDRERIARCAFDYGNGGWEARLTGIFGRTLGSTLGRRDTAPRHIGNG